MELESKRQHVMCSSLHPRCKEAAAACVANSPLAAQTDMSPAQADKTAAAGARSNKRRTAAAAPQEPASLETKSTHLWTTSPHATAPRPGPWQAGCPARGRPAAALQRPTPAAAAAHQLGGRLTALPSGRYRWRPASPRRRCCLLARPERQLLRQGRPAAAGQGSGWPPYSWVR